MSFCCSAASPRTKAPIGTASAGRFGRRRGTVPGSQRGLRVAQPLVMASASTKTATSRWDINGLRGTMTKGGLKRNPQPVRRAPAPRRRRPTLLSADPYGAAPIVFLLPDRHELLQPIDEPVAGLECLGAMARAHRDADAGFADRHHAHPMHHRDAPDRPSAPCLARQRPHLPHRHRGERLVLEAGHAPARVLVARGAEEEHGRARGRIADRRQQSPGVDRRVVDLEQLSHRSPVGRTRPRHHRRARGSHRRSVR